MKPQAFLVLTTVFLMGADAPTNDKDRIQPTWVVEDGTKNGQPLPKELRQSLRITFAGDKLILRSAGQKNEGTFALDPSKKPAEITITHSDGKTLPSKGIYGWREDKLILWLAEPGMARPTGFQAKKGDKLEILVLAKEKAGG